MIPLRDTIRSRTFPVVNVILIALNLAVFLYESGLTESELTRLFNSYGVVPAVQGKILDNPLNLDAWIPMFTTIFLHGSWLHILGNMLYLWVFGDNVEDAMGHRNYLFFYLGAGLAGSFAHIFANPESMVPTVGASGAIAGVMGAYFVTFRRSRILTLVPIFIIPVLTELPAVIFLFLWFALQMVNGLVSAAVPGNTVAWWAHIGGFALGMLLGRVIGPRRRTRF
ncbi:MAG: rhomboid family intramembrane serine protease [Thermoanaerobacterales bacterium]|nr:rhomboid family intramembrane serine protease [Thermoanaerobacterales bacterium]